MRHGGRDYFTLVNVFAWHETRDDSKIHAEGSTR
jgi:hypothetical protein